LATIFPQDWLGLADALEPFGRYKDALSALYKAIDRVSDYVGALLNSQQVNNHRPKASNSQGWRDQPREQPM
jgi:hypothetical protein